MDNGYKSLHKRKTTTEQYKQLTKDSNRNRNINFLETDNNQEDYKEEEVYITRKPRPTLYSTNRKQVNKKASETQKEFNLQKKKLL